MCYWWVNQNQTYRHEVNGGYLWSPKRNQGGGLNPFYEFMREVSPGDLVFSFANTKIGAFGIARSHAYEAPKPDEFGTAGRNWEAIGWRVDVEFHEVQKPFRPADWIERLRPFLPDRYSPLQSDGRGLQGVYLTELSAALAFELADLLGNEVAALARAETVPIVFPSRRRRSCCGRNIFERRSRATPRCARRRRRRSFSRVVGRDCFASECGGSSLIAA